MHARASTRMCTFIGMPVCSRCPAHVFSVRAARAAQRSASLSAHSSINIPHALEHWGSANQHNPSVAGLRQIFFLFLLTRLSITIDSCWSLNPDPRRRRVASYRSVEARRAWPLRGVALAPSPGKVFGCSWMKTFIFLSDMKNNLKLFWEI